MSFVELDPDTRPSSPSPLILCLDYHPRTLVDASQLLWRLPRRLYTPTPALDQTVTATPSSQAEHPNGPLARLGPTQNAKFRMSVIDPIHLTPLISMAFVLTPPDQP